MTLHEARAAIGQHVVHRPAFGAPALGWISSVGEHLVFVRYGVAQASQGTHAGDLELVDDATADAMRGAS